MTFTSSRHMRVTTMPVNLVYDRDPPPSLHSGVRFLMSDNDSDYLYHFLRLGIPSPFFFRKEGGSDDMKEREKTFVFS